MPSATGGSRKDFKTEMTRAIMKLAADDALDHDSLAAAVEAVVADYRHVLPTGTYLPTDPHALPAVLCVTRPPAVAAAAIPARPAPAKQAKGKSSSALPVPPVAQPAPGYCPPTYRTAFAPPHVRARRRLSAHHCRVGSG